MFVVEFVKQGGEVGRTVVNNATPDFAQALKTPEGRLHIEALYKLCGFDVLRINEILPVEIEMEVKMPELT